MREIKRMIKMWEEGYFDMSLGDACNEYGGCQFKSICLTQDPAPWLEISFERRHWDPVARKETKL